MAEPNSFIMRAHMGQGPGADPGQDLFTTRVATSLAAVLSAWKVTARFEGLQINGPTVIGKPGCLQGPALAAGIRAGIAPRDDWERKMAAAIGAGIDARWKAFTDSFSIPGLPWYPAFAAMPAPQAPPMANVPCPLIALPHVSDTLRADNVAAAITGQARDLVGAKALAVTIGAGFAPMVLSWVTMLIITKVMGTGPVPTFAPPYVPVGPVVNGTNLPTPGIFA